MSEAKNGKQRRKGKVRHAGQKRHARVVVRVLSPASKVEREKVQAAQAFRTETKRQKKEGRPAAPHNTGQDLINQQQISTTSPVNNNGASPSRLSRVLSMSNMATAYGSNLAFQDLFDGATSGVPLAEVDVFEPVDGPAVDLDDHQSTMLRLLSQKLRSLADDNARLQQTNKELSEANESLRSELKLRPVP
jgi:hypothetical protein